MSDTLNPFTPEDYQALVRARQKLGQAGELIRKCAACGMDVQQREQRRQEFDNVLALLQQHFFPDANP